MHNENAPPGGSFKNGETLPAGTERDSEMERTEFGTKKKGVTVTAVLPTLRQDLADSNSTLRSRVARSSGVRSLTHRRGENELE